MEIRPDTTKKLTDEELKEHIRYCLKNAAEFYKCTIEELEYKVDSKQYIHIRKKK